MTAMVVAMVLALLAALVVISVFSSPEQDEARPDQGETRLEDLLDP